MNVSAFLLFDVLVTANEVEDVLDHFFKARQSYIFWKT